MGREKVLSKIKKDCIIFVVFGAIITLLCGFMDLAFIVAGISENVAPFILFTALTALGIGMLYSGIKGLRNPENTHALKKNPNLLRQADELFAHVIYEDNFIILSDRIIAVKKNISQMAYTDEVFLIYVYKQTTNFITTTKQLVLQTARGQLEINIYGKSSKDIEALAEKIAHSCRYARVGYSGEGLQYVEQMRKLWKEDQEKNNKAV